MNKHVTIVLILISIILIGGATSCDLSQLSDEDIDKIIVCNKPYMRYASGCCLDSNDNSICDGDEGKSSTLTTEGTCPKVTDIVFNQSILIVDETYDYVMYFSDPDNDLLEYTRTIRFPGGKVITDTFDASPTAKKITRNIWAGDIGTLTVEVSARDKAGCKSNVLKKTFTIVDETPETTSNSCPEIKNIEFNKPTTSDIPSWYRQILFTYSDPDNDIVSMTKTIIYPDGEVKTSKRTNMNSQTSVGLYYDMSRAGTVKVSIYATDSRGCDSDVFTKSFQVEGKSTTNVVTPTYDDEEEEEPVYVPPTSSGPKILFSDDFSGTFPGNDWNIYNYYSDVDSGISTDKGDPSLKLSGDNLETTNSWPTSGGTKFSMKIAFPPDEDCTGSSALIQLKPLSRAGVYSQIRVTQKDCDAPMGGTIIEYWTTLVGGYRATQHETIGKGGIDGSFHEFSFTVLPDGTVEIRRDGNLKSQGNPQDYRTRKDPLPRNMKLSITGGEIYIDDFKVTT